MTPILHLPPEITGYIVEHLSLNDLLCLRQTCHTLNNNTFHLFSPNVFAKIQGGIRRVMLERRSLEALAYIAEHPTFGPFITEVEISTNHLLPPDELRTIEPPSRPISEMEAMIERWRNGQHEDTGEEVEEEDEGGDEENTSGEESDSDNDHCPHLRLLDEGAYLKAFHDQEELIRRGDDIDYLTRAMKSLVNCVTIRITDDNRIWGLKRLRKEIGVLPQRCLTFKSPKSIETVRRMLHALFTALAQGNTSVSLLDISASSTIDNANRISADMLATPLPRTLDEFQLSTLTSLFLNIDSKSPEHNPTSINWTYDLIRFINRFPELSQFSIEFETRDEDAFSFTGSFHVDEPTIYTRFPRLSQLLYIPKLKEVRLGMINCTGMDIAFFLLRHQKTLIDIHLEGINLLNTDPELGGWPWLVEVIRDSFQITSFIIENCTGKDDRSLLSREDRDAYYDPDRELFKATNSEDFNSILKLLRKRDS